MAEEITKEMYQILMDSFLNQFISMNERMKELREMDKEVNKGNISIKSNQNAYMARYEASQTLRKEMEKISVDIDSLAEQVYKYADAYHPVFAYALKHFEKKTNEQVRTQKMYLAHPQWYVDPQKQIKDCQTKIDSFQERIAYLTLLIDISK